DQDRPRRVVERTKHDFGVVSNARLLECHLTISNAGQEQLLVEANSVPVDVQVNCEVCAVPPGESTEIELKWMIDENQWRDISDGAEVNRKILLRTNDPIDPDVAIELVASKARALVYPEDVGFGKLRLGEKKVASFVVTSEVFQNLAATAVECDEPGVVAQSRLVEGAGSVFPSVEIGVSIERNEYGPFGIPVKISLLADGEFREVAVQLKGQVKSPITFSHPELHRVSGLDIGTLSSKERTSFKVQVRVREETDREMAVLAVEPKALRAELVPSSIEGVYKLVLTVPEGCPTIQFNRSDYRGYVEVGDPNDENFSNWLPVSGVIVKE
ncbi:hypothetical protein, partial [Rhodopirellula bahusiensis]